MATSPYQQFKTDEKFEQDGIFLDYGAFRLKIARAGGANVRFNKVLQMKFKPHRRAMQMDTMDDNLAKKLLAEAYAEAVVLGWDTKDEKSGKLLPYVLDENGEEMEFNRDNCVKLLTDLPDLFADLQQQAQAVSNFRVEDQKIAAKNSKKA